MTSLSSTAISSRFSRVASSTLISGTTIINFSTTLRTVDGTATLNLDGATVAGGTLSGDGMIVTVGDVNTLDDIAITSITTVNVTDNTVLDLNAAIA